jgi:hypothetical protein
MVIDDVLDNKTGLDYWGGRIIEPGIYRIAYQKLYIGIQCMKPLNYSPIYLRIF